MKVRKPDYDFTVALPHWWKGYPEVAQHFNVSSLGFPYLEPYLNVVMRRAQAQLGPEHPLNHDISLFCKQEAIHYLQHGAYNQALHRAGYEAVPEIERRYKEHFDRLLNEKSLKFNCAYCLGFETLGPVAAEMWFEGMNDLLESTDPSVLGLWKWHLAEEYEHRTVAYDVYQALYGDYFCRIYALYCFIRDWRRLAGQGLIWLLEHDYKNMSGEEIALSRARLAAFKRRESRFSLPRLMRAVSPLYNPAKIKAPKGVAELLEKVADAA
jgi:predicted metal-dependent hydrolase